VSQLVGALRYKPGGRGFRSRWCHWNFHWHNPSGRTMDLESTQILSHVSTRNIWKLPGGKYGRCVGLTNLSPSCAECLEIWKLQPHWILKACPGLYRDYFTFTSYSKSFGQAAVQYSGAKVWHHFKITSMVVYAVLETCSNLRPWWRILSSSLSRRLEARAQLMASKTRKKEAKTLTTDDLT